MSPLEGKTVLLVDDEESVRAAISVLLDSLRLVVTPAASGNEALEQYRRQPFDFVITDYTMPGMTGDAFARAVKVLNPEQGIIMLSGYYDDLLVGGKVISYVDALLPKPCSRETLAATLTAIQTGSLSSAQR